MKKDHRAGGKFGGSHTTLIPAAGILADVAHQQGEVRKISLGLITASLSSVNGKRRAKVQKRLGNLLVSVRDNTTRQEIVIYTDDPQKTMRSLYRGGRDEGIEVSFVDE